MDKILKNNQVRASKTSDDTRATNDTCPICLDLINYEYLISDNTTHITEQNSNIVVFTCNHQVCNECCIELIICGQFNKCPICRQTIKILTASKTIVDLSEQYRITQNPLTLRVNQISDIESQYENRLYTNYRQHIFSDDNIEYDGEEISDHYDFDSNHDDNEGEDEPNCIEKYIEILCNRDACVYYIVCSMFCILIIVSIPIFCSCYPNYLL